MKLVLLVLVGLLLVASVAMVRQHQRYLHVRRDLVHDRQPLLYDSDAFHVLTLLRVDPGSDVIEAVRGLEAEAEGVEGGTWVYAGKVAVNGLRSSQVGDVEWSAAVLVQYPSRSAYEQAARSDVYQQALGRFTESYSHGLERGRAFNLVLPQLLLARRAQQWVTREPSSFPFVPVPESELPERATGLVERLFAERELGANAVLIVNLIKDGTPEQQAENGGYGWRMMGAMAEGGYGPMHIGRAVRLEGTADFDSVVLVYYPGVGFFADMVRSEFFRGIIGGKQLGDTLSSVTVPILDRL